MSKRSARMSEPPPGRGHVWPLPGVSQSEIEYMRAKLTGRPTTPQCRLLSPIPKPEKTR